MIADQSCASKRIAIVGCAGSGKTTFARTLHHLTDLPLIHLDTKYWLPNWSRPEHHEWMNQHGRLVSQRRWILDGNYMDTVRERVAAADDVVFLDIPPALCIARVRERAADTLNSIVIPRDLPYGCPERDSVGLIDYIMRFPSERRPLLLRVLQMKPRSVAIHKVHNWESWQEVLRTVVARVNGETSCNHAECPISTRRALSALIERSASAGTHSQVIPQ